MKFTRSPQEGYLVVEVPGMINKVSIHEMHTTEQLESSIIDRMTVKDIINLTYEQDSPFRAEMRMVVDSLLDIRFRVYSALTNSYHYGTIEEGVWGSGDPIFDWDGSERSWRDQFEMEQPKIVRVSLGDNFPCMDVKGNILVSRKSSHICQLEGDRLIFHNGKEYREYIVDDRLSEVRDTGTPEWARQYAELGGDPFHPGLSKEVLERFQGHIDPNPLYKGKTITVRNNLVYWVLRQGEWIQRDCVDSLTNSEYEELNMYENLS